MIRAVSRYSSPILPILQARTALIPSRKAISAARLASTFFTSSLRIRFSVSWTRLRGKTLTYWDCWIPTVRAVSREPSKTCSPVWFSKSAIRIQSRSWKARALAADLKKTAFASQAAAITATTRIIAVAATRTGFKNLKTFVRTGKPDSISFRSVVTSAMD